MQNISHRFSCHINNEKTIRENKSAEAEYMNYKSTLNDRKLFRIDPETGKPFGKPAK